MNKTNKKNKELIILLIIFLSIVSLLLLMGSTFSFFKKESTASGQIQLGELDFTITTSKYNKIIMPGDLINLTATISNKVEGKTRLIPFYFRFKLTNDESCEITPNMDNFILGQDDYYYYKYKLTPDSNQTLFSSIKIYENVSSASSINISIIIDAVQSEHEAYQEIFENAPSEWVEFIENN